MSSTRDFLVGVVVGSAIGAVAALLYAPQAGADTRLRIREKADEARDRTAELADQARQRAAEISAQAQGKIDEVRNQAAAKADQITQQAQDAIDRGKRLLDTQKQAVTTAVEAGKQAYVEKRAELEEEVAADALPAGASPAV